MQLVEFRIGGGAGYPPAEKRSRSGFGRYLAGRHRELKT